MAGPRKRPAKGKASKAQGTPTATPTPTLVLAAASVALLAAGIRQVYVYQQPAGGAGTGGYANPARPPLEPIAPDSPAARLAGLINKGVPVDVRSHLTPGELEAALGTMRPTSLGWRERVGSFLELIEGSSPERWTEEDLKKRRAERFDTPLVVVRKRGGIAAKVTEELTRANLLASDPLVKPSRCAALAINANATTKGADGEYNPDLMPFSQCATCEVPLSTFLERVDRPFGLGTPASDDSNIQLQTHGIQGPQLPALGRLLSGNAPRLFRHPVLDKKFFPPSCRNPPALGFAGTLRGLPFHQHQANWNEAVVGRKMFAFFPPRVRAADNQDNKMPCGWPPWAPKAAEQSDGEQINKMLGSFFTGRYNASARPPAAAEGGGGGESPPLTTCLDQSITPLNWLVHEMPLLAAEHRPLLFIAHPGELVWIPDDWLHLTINVDDALYVYRASCADAPLARRRLGDPASAADAKTQAAMADRLCKNTGRFCTGYCHAFCKACDGRDCDCATQRHKV